MLRALTLALLLTATARAQDVAGTWSGPLEFPGGTLELVFHLVPDGDGYTATADSPVQNAFGIPASASLDGDQITITIDAVGATFVGTREGDALVGTFTQGFNEMPARLVRQPGEAEPDDGLAELIGDWEGVLMGALPVVVRLTPGESADVLNATLDSPSQDSFGNPSTGARLEDGTLVIEFPGLGGRFEGEVQGDTISGTWSQGQDLPLVLTRSTGETTGSNAAPVSRPQTDDVPSRREEDLSVDSAPGIRLAGTLTLPEGAGPFPAVVLVSGSGPQDRDATIFGHKPFALWADRLADAGIATYRFDDRGTAQSTGDWASASIREFSADAAASVRALLAREDISAVGVMGHSEGGYVAPRVARMVQEAAFVVLLAGPGVPGHEVYAEQHRLLAMAGGMAEAPARLYSEIIAALVSPYAEPVASNDRRQRGEAAARAVLADADPDLVQELTGGLDPQSTFDTILNFVSTPGVGSFIGWDPRQDLEDLSIPALAVFTEYDLQVPPAQSEPAMTRALAASGSPAHAVVTFEGLNHLFQPTTTGRPEEYGEIETTVSEEVLDFVADWIAGVTN